MSLPLHTAKNREEEEEEEERRGAGEGEGGRQSLPDPSLTKAMTPDLYNELVSMLNID